MSAPKHQGISIDKSHDVNIDLLASVCVQKPCITSLSGFLDEADSFRALGYWLTHFESITADTTTNDIYCIINKAIAHIDHLINDQLNELIHHPALQKLEASWRGLWYLVAQADGNRNIKIRYLDITWSEVTKDIERALDVDQSQLFQKIYSEEYGTPGGEPYGVIIGDYEISHKRSSRHPLDDIATLNGLSQIAAAAFAPFIASTSSEFFGLDDFSTLGMPINLQSIFAQTEYIKWRALREKQDSRFLGLTLPRILMREPYRTSPGSYKGIFFYEKPRHENQSSSQLWGNAAYAFGGVLIREFASVGWFGHIRGVPRDQIGGGLLTNLPSVNFDTDDDNIACKPSVDVVITDTMERELSDLGLMPLCHCYDTPFCAFYSNQSVQQPRHRLSRADDINAKLSAMLQHVLCASRVAHYLKVMIRDKVGSFITAEECERFLTEWLFKYTTGREDLEWEEQARYPLRQAAVNVTEHPNKPGQYLCVIHLVPHYQLDQMVSELELVTELMQTS
ncbi:type VI secretion protein [Cellvibrio sp. PSBB023]|nr:type VI secretion system contractile sheath large subunit [Cellvibrio sp. PSBB023]AQT61187.1 type VI secretion protein [Cellvibrio sp. PSBB023]